MSIDQSTEKKPWWKSMGSNDDLSLKTIKSCTKVCKTAFYASLWSGILSPIFLYIISTGALGTEIQLQMGGLDWTVLVQSLIFIVAGYYTMKGSRVAAVILFLIFAVGQIGTMIATGGKFGGSGSVFWWLIYGYAIVASFKWNKLLKKDTTLEIDNDLSPLEINKDSDNSPGNIIKIVVAVLMLLGVGVIIFNNLEKTGSDNDKNNSAQKVINFIDQGSGVQNATGSYDRDEFAQRAEYMTTGAIEKELLLIEQSNDSVVKNNAKILRANVYSSQGLYDKSNEILLNLIDNYNFDDYSTIYKILCLNYAKLQNFSTAEGYCDKLVFTDLDQDVQALVVAIYIGLGNHKKALEFINQGLSLNSGNVALIYSRAVANISKNPTLDSEKDSIINDLDFAIGNWTGEDVLVGRMYVSKGYIQLLKDQKDVGCANIKKGLLIDADLKYQELRDICNL